MCFLVHMFAPQNLTASRINARNASLAWEWSDLQYRKLRVLCQIILNSKGDTDVVSVYNDVTMSIRELDSTFSLFVLCSRGTTLDWV